MLPGAILFLAAFLSNSDSNPQESHRISLASCGQNPLNKATFPPGPKSHEGALMASEAFPWHVVIQTKDSHICAGATLSSWWILSAAHCFLKELLPDLRIIVSLDGYQLGQRKLDRIIIHQDFDPANRNNDIALILLDSPIAFDAQMMPICLPLMHDLRMWQDCWVTSWSATVAGAEKKPSGVLRKAEMTLLSRKLCSENVQGLTGNMLCAFSEEGRKDACQGDSGGPLVCAYGDIAKWFVVGVASRGNSCGNQQNPTVYTLVFNYVDWIQKATAREGKPFIPQGVDNATAGSLSRSEAFQSHSAAPIRHLQGTFWIAPLFILIALGS